MYEPVSYTHLDVYKRQPNYHAHLVADWQDLQTGKTLKHQSFHYSKMQDLTAECLQMERGKSNSGIQRLEAVEFKIKKKEEDLKILEEQYNQMKSEIASRKFEELSLIHISKTKKKREICKRFNGARNHFRLI